jgi:aminoglycoside phosphotransferase (APT) family kinase protein
VFHPTENRIIAVLDWELATVGKAFADIAYMTQFYHTRAFEEGPVKGGIKGLPVPINHHILDFFASVTQRVGSDWALLLLSPT